MSHEYEGQSYYNGYRPRRSRPNSPLRHTPSCPYNDIHIETIETERRRRSICDECREPVRHNCGDEKREDFGSQVIATDINAADCAQTGPSLCQSSRELPRRRCGCTEQKVGRKSWNLCCDCEQPHRSCSKSQEPPRDCAAQADVRDICESESVQTGPSLSASGPYCKFDYKLRKTKPAKEDCYVDCHRPKGEAEPHALCSSDRYACTSFGQQVNATDINITDWAQTGEGEGHDCGSEKIRCGKTQPQFSRKMVKSDDLFDCECPCPESQGEKSTREFTTQVWALCISESKYVQTDGCQQQPAGGSRRVRVLRCRDWEERECLIIDRRPKPAKPTTCQCAANDTQVATDDIGGCDEAQTGKCLFFRKLSTRSCTQTSTDTKCCQVNRVIVARVRNSSIDGCRRSDTVPKADAQVAGCAQVRACDLNKSHECKTGDGKPKMVKHFVRGGPWCL